MSQSAALDSLLLKPVALVRSPRKNPEDDNWGGMQSRIEFDESRFGSESLAGLSDFSHLEVIFYMNQVNPDKIESSARHPRNNKDWPKVGIFAQRGKNRPNQLALSRCRILGVEGSAILVEGLDAIDQSPVLDVKPYMKGFEARGEIKEPQWSVELMKTYYDPSDDKS